MRAGKQSFRVGREDRRGREDLGGVVSRGQSRGTVQDRRQPWCPHTCYIRISSVFWLLLIATLALSSILALLSALCIKAWMWDPKSQSSAQGIEGTTPGPGFQQLISKEFSVKTLADPHEQLALLRGPGCILLLHGEQTQYCCRDKELLGTDRKTHVQSGFRAELFHPARELLFSSRDLVTWETAKGQQGF